MVSPRRGAPGLRHLDLTVAAEAGSLAAASALTVEIPLKAIVRGHTYEVIPTNWTNRTSGVPKLAMKEMGSRYLFIVIYVWLESVLSRGDYRVREDRKSNASV